MNTNRWFHIDFHNMPGIDNFCHKFDADKLADMLSSINVTRVNLFAVCNIGFSYYNTKIGIPYPGLKCDMFGESLKACHKKGIDVVAYINIGINHELALKRPEFCRINEKGQIIGDNKMSSFSRTMCYNNDGYIEYTKSVIKEILQYDIDGMFLDCCVVRPCYCSKCVKEMLSGGIDISDESAVFRFAQEKAIKYGKTMRSLIPEGMSLYVNSMPYDKMQEIDTHIEVESLPGGWGYDYFPAAASYARNLFKDVTYMTGRFQKMWADFGGYRSMASLEYDAFDSLMYGTGFSVGDHMHPNGLLDESLFKDLKKIYSLLESYEPWTDKAKYIKEIAVLRNYSKAGEAFITPALRGVSRLLSELKYNFDIVNEDMDFSPYKLIIMADEFDIDEKTKEKLSAFTSAGGALLSSGSAGICKDCRKFVLDEYSYLSYEGEESGYEDGWAAYYRPEDDTRDYSEYSPGILMKNNGGTSLAKHIPAYFPRHFDGLHGHVYIPPKEEDDGYCTIAMNGKTAHISFPVFSSYYKFSYPEHRKLVEKLLSKLISGKMIIADELPVNARATITGNDEYKLLHIKTTYPEGKGLTPVVDEHITLPSGKTVCVDGEYAEVSLLPSGKKIESVIENGYTKITLPEICGYDMFLLK